MTRARSMFFHRDGFTLIEVLMTVVVIGILATVALRSLQNAVDNSRVRETETEMDELTLAIAGNADLYANGLRADFGYVGDVGSLPASLDNLVTNPGGYSTWQGPYVRSRFTEDAEGFKRDAWGNLYTLTSGISINSTGGGTLPMTKTVASAAGDLTSTPLSGTVTDAAGNPPGDSSIAVTVQVTYPDGSGGTTSASANPTAGGSFSFSGLPVGIRLVEAVYRATGDTTRVYAALLPRTGATLTMRLPGAPFAAVTGGGGAGGSSIQFVPGTASSPSDDVYFSIYNAGSAGVLLASLTATYTPTAYFESVSWAGTTVCTNSPLKGSGETCTFTSVRTVNAGTTVAVRLQNFRTLPSGGSTYSFSSVDFTITFSNGQSVTFNSL